MAAPVGNTTRAALIWGGLAAVVIGGFFVVVAILNATVYSAPGFVRGYLDALDQGDTGSALSLAGVTPGADDVLLTVSESGRISDAHVVSDHPTARGGRVVTVSFRAGGATHRAPFAVEKDGVFGGLFTRWAFQTAPTASIEITPAHDPRFTANGVAIRSKSADLATRYTVLAPAVFELAHDTTYLTAAPATAVVAAPGAVVKATVTVAPKKSFVQKVTTDVTKYLRTTCLPQRVLLPSGCPFGEQIDDRLTSEPTWSMTSYPPVTMRPTATAGVWLVSEATGEAHLKVGAQSLYDGHPYTIDERVPFQVEYLVTIGSDNRLTITPR
ncbi:hypothetical protein GCM10025867_05810 [Frondihabitans sucicola]|uniref:Uncharacterized protein n=1 Tax=Frondihabitans sucicola TaxID=1268041 RepID=A0ABN6XTN2_9MICO|nr:hypothetical protein [Frondihabitans sucicola]BDZ48340.1 hypothetical protein GCM10025867_05810 [Frondihabitans sucicola]